MKLTGPLRFVLIWDRNWQDEDRILESFFVEPIEVWEDNHKRQDNWCGCQLVMFDHLKRMLSGAYKNLLAGEHHGKADRS